MHALTSINSPGHRQNQHRAELPRRLDRIVVTVPANLHAREQQILRARLDAAVDLIWQGLGWAPNPASPRRPSITLVNDNAANAEIAYLFNEITHKFRGKAREYLDLMGKIRPNQRSGKSLRIAALDIGGGSLPLRRHMRIGRDRTDRSCSATERWHELRRRRRRQGDHRAARDPGDRAASGGLRPAQRPSVPRSDHRRRPLVSKAMACRLRRPLHVGPGGARRHGASQRAQGFALPARRRALRTHHRLAARFDRRGRHSRRRCARRVGRGRRHGRLLPARYAAHVPPSRPGRHHPRRAGASAGERDPHRSGAGL